MNEYKQYSLQDHKEKRKKHVAFRCDPEVKEVLDFLRDNGHNVSATINKLLKQNLLIQCLDDCPICGKTSITINLEEYEDLKNGKKS